MLEKLELRNFKTYPSGQLEFKNYVAICGPNGAGKSTILEAIAFVFCLDPFKKLPRQSRPNFLKGLRKKICSHADSDISSPLESTGVKITVSHKNQEKTLTRIVDWGKEICEYTIDNEMLTEEKYMAYLLPLNITNDYNHFLIQQNQLESIALLNDRERTILFEQISSSIQYKQQYDETKQRITDLKLEQNKIRSDQNALSKCLKRMRPLQKEYDTFKEKELNLQNMETEYYLALVHFVLTKIKKLTQELKEKKDSLETIVMPNDLQLHIQNNLEELTNLIKDKEIEIKSTTDRVIELKDLIKKYERIKNKAEQEFDSVQKDLTDLNQQLNDVNTRKNAIEKSYSEKELDAQEFYKYLELKSRFEIENSNLLIKQQNLKINFELQRQRADEYDRNLKSKKKKLENLKETLVKFRSQYKDLESEHKKLSDEIVSTKEKIDVIDNKLEEYEKSLEDTNEKYTFNKKHKRNREILKVLETNFGSSIYGRLSNLCEIPKEFQISVIKLLGSEFDAIIVDNTQTAYDCIRYLKKEFANDRNNAYATFIPLDHKMYSTQKKNKLMKSPDLRKTYKIIYDVVDEIKIKNSQCSDSLKHYLKVNWGDIVVCESDEEASELARQGKSAVSKDGTYYRKGGIFSGGKADLMKKCEEIILSQEQENLSEKRDSISEEARKLKKRRRELLEKKNSLVEQRLTYENKLKLYENPDPKEGIIIEYQKKLQSEIISLEIEIEKLVSESSHLSVDQKELQRKLMDIEEFLNNAKNKIFSSFCQMNGFENIDQYLSGDFMKLKSIKEKLANYELLISKIDGEIKDLEEKSMRRKEILKKWNEKLKLSKEESQEIVCKKETQERELEKYEDKLKEIKAINDENNKKFQEKNDALKRAKVLKKDIQKIERELIELKGKRHGVLLECQLNNITIPFIYGDMRDLNLINESEQSDLSTNGNESEFELHPSLLPENFKSLNDKDFELQLEKIKNEKNKLEEELQDLHLSSQGKKPDDTGSRLRIVKSQHNKVVEDIKRLEKRFDVLKIKRTEQFVLTYNMITKVLDSIYKNLCQSEEAQIHLLLENPEEPYLGGISFSAIPPRKCFVKVENMSGGERSLAALALLVAINKAKPTPFILFDEIDSHLDYATIGHLGLYLNHIQRKQQVIIVSHNVPLLRSTQAIIGITINKHLPNQFSIIIHMHLEKMAEDIIRIAQSSKQDKEKRMRMASITEYTDFS